MEVNQVYQMDALELLRSLEPASVGAVISDFPYGTTAASWDVAPDLPKLWEAIKHALKPNGVVVTTASQPFTSMLVMSNLKWFRYEWIWDKSLAGNFLLADTQPLKTHENVVVFSQDASRYNPQMTKGLRRKKGGGKSNLWSLSKTTTTNDEYHPLSIIRIANTDRANVEHPTQKPVALYEYLILTYTQSGALVVDPYCGSGTTCIAARNTGRHFIGGDLSPEYVAIARKRLAQPYTVPMFTD